MQVGLEKVIALLTAGLLVGPVVAQDLGKRPEAADPGPRPVGNQSIPVKGAIFSVGVPDSIQPKDADGNGAGRQLPKLTTDQTAFWFASLVVFGQQVTVDGASDPSTNNPTLEGLGPAFNGDSCGVCHSFPAIGGSSPPVNPQIALAKARGAQNSIPPFLSLKGPVREARFVNAAGDGLPRAPCIRSLRFRGAAMHRVAALCHSQILPGSFTGVMWPCGFQLPPLV
jgi:hypothetical protein